MTNRSAKYTFLVSLLFIVLSSTTMSQHFTGARKMGSVLNSPSDEQGGVVAPSGLSFYFTSNRPGGQSLHDIYVSKRATLGSAWGPPQNLGSIVNSADSELVPSFSLDGRTMFFTRAPQSGGPPDIYMTTRTDAADDLGWSAPVNLGAPINTQFSERGATYFEDPVTGVGMLIFAREIDPTQTPFHDLYQSTRSQNGTFNEPTPIAELNSIGSEIRATFRRDGLEVLIHTSRPGGSPPIGSFDIFVARRSAITSPWDVPTPVPGLNAAQANEGGQSLSPDGSILYFHSSRPGGLGGNDLYTATRCSLYSVSPCAVDRTAADFDGDGKTDLSVFRPSSGVWWLVGSATNTVSVYQFGMTGDRPTAGDYDGDGQIDLAIFRPSTGDWWILPSSTGAAYTTRWGVSTDQLVPGDYDGDGMTDIAVYRNGVWYIRKSSAGAEFASFGAADDVPLGSRP